MTYTVKAEMTKKEFYKFFIGDFLSMFIVGAIISFHIGNGHIGYNLLFSVDFLRETWHIVLYNWFIVLLIFESILLLGALVLALTKKHEFLSKKTYTFTEAFIHVETDVSQSKISWDKLMRVRNKRAYILLTFNGAKSIYLLDSFFANSQQKNEVLYFIQKKREEGHP